MFETFNNREVVNNLGKVQDTRKADRKMLQDHTDILKAWISVNPDRVHLIHMFGGGFRISRNTEQNYAA